MQSSSGTLYVDPWEITAMEVAPELNDGEDYHIFISYSSTDSDWARALIQELESAIPNLKACYHERDFLPGKTIVENMSTAIQRSQKVLLVLSRDFVRSRWCLMEANLSVFQESMHQKPVIPLMREHCLIPLHLTHLTYLDTKDKDFFAKLLSLICSSNQSMKNVTLVPYQPLSLYNGKHLLCLSALNKHNLGKYDGSTFSENIPNELRMVCDDDEVYRKAIHIINKTSSRNVRSCYNASILTALLGGLCFALFLILASSAFSCSPPSKCPRDPSDYILMGAMFAVSTVSAGIWMHLRYAIGKGRLKQMSLAAGRANYSSNYTSCVAQNHFPFAYFDLNAGHMGNVPCFCEYVFYCLQKEKMETCCSVVLSKYCLDFELP